MIALSKPLVAGQCLPQGLLIDRIYSRHLDKAIGGSSRTFLDTLPAISALQKVDTVATEKALDRLHGTSELARRALDADLRISHML